MDIFLLRHADAEPPGESNRFEDEARALTQAGRKQMGEVTHGLKLLGVELDLIASSPLVRAHQTAEIAAEELEFKEKIQLWEELAPGQSVKKLLERLKQADERESILLVGHEPDMGLLASQLLCGSSRAAIPFKKAGICHIQVRTVSPLLAGELKWMLSPKVIELLRK
jgi:phosphohistidine phosphatase